jgi:serine/threonine protein kinase
MLRDAVYTYIQSRFYRSPEVILGQNYHMSIDVSRSMCAGVTLRKADTLLTLADVVARVHHGRDVHWLPDLSGRERAGAARLYHGDPWRSRQVSRRSQLAQATLFRLDRSAAARCQLERSSSSAQLQDALANPQDGRRAFCRLHREMPRMGSGSPPQAGSGRPPPLDCANAREQSIRTHPRPFEPRIFHRSQRESATLDRHACQRGDYQYSAETEAVCFFVRLDGSSSTNPDCVFDRVQLGERGAPRCQEFPARSHSLQCQVMSPDHSFPLRSSTSSVSTFHIPPISAHLMCGHPVGEYLRLFQCAVIASACSCVALCVLAGTNT